MDLEYDLPTLIQQFISPKGDHSSALNSIILNKQTTLLQLFTVLQTYFLSEDPLIRSRACLLIYEVLVRLPNITLDQQQFIALSTFFVSKLKDEPTVVESIGVLSILFERYQLYNDDLILLYLSHLQQLGIPGYPQEVRMNVYRTLKIVTGVMKTSGDSFIVLLLNVTEGERDPRNILVVFGLFGFVLERMDAYALKNEIFEQLDCYYPIEFNQNADQRFQISQAQLVEALDVCYSSLIILDLVLVSIEDKLLSSHQPAQIASLMTLSKIFTINSNIPQQLVKKVWGMFERFMELNLQGDLYGPLIQALESFMSYLNESKTMDLQDIVIKQFLFVLQDRTLSDMSNVSLDILLSFTTISEPLRIKTIEALLKQFVQCYSQKDIELAQKRIQIVLKTIQRAGLIDNQQRTIYTLQEALTSDIDTLVVLSMKTLMEINTKMLHSAEIFNSIHEVVLGLLTSERSILLKKCCTDYFGSVRLPLAIKQAYRLVMIQSEVMVQSEVFEYARPSLFALYPEIYSQYRDELKDQSDLVNYLSPLLRYFTLGLGRPDVQEFMFYFRVLSPQYLEPKSLEIVKQLSQYFEQSLQKDEYYGTVYQMFQDTLQYPNRLEFYITVIDEIKDIPTKSKLLMMLWEQISLLQFTSSYTINYQNSMNVCRLLKRILRSNQDLLTHSTKLSLYSATSTGISEFLIQTTFLKIGLSLNDQFYVNLVKDLIEQNISNQEQIKLLLSNIVVNYRSVNSWPNYSTWIIEQILMKIIVIGNQQLAAQIYFCILIKIDSSILKYYDELWPKTILLAKHYLSLNNGQSHNAKSTLDIVLAVSQYSSYTVEVVPFLIEVLMLPQLSNDTKVQVLIALGQNAHLYDSKLFKDVVWVLQGLLDHPKRIIRRNTSYAINQWFIMGGRGI